ncbi:MAG: PadR family transcriptional regulator [Candidatus Saccharimonadales bacterium]
MQDNDQQFSQLRKGLLEFAVLSAVSGKHAYVADVLKRLEGTPFETSEGTLYPLLSRLKREQLLTYKWVESETGPPRKYYGLTAIGEARLDQMHHYWSHLYKSLETIGETHA